MLLEVVEATGRVILYMGSDLITICVHTALAHLDNSHAASENENL